MTDSSTGGYLVPNTSPAPLEDGALDAFLQAMVVGIVALPGNTVFPRWQPEPPNLPAYGTNWAAIGVTDQNADVFPAVIHHGDGQGYDELQRHEELTVTASFYGPLAGTNAKLLRDGLAIAQNREPMELAGMGLVEVQPVRKAPELIKDRWTNRQDLIFVIRRIVVREYQVLNVLDVDIQLEVDDGSYNETTHTDTSA